MVDSGCSNGVSAPLLAVLLAFAVASGPAAAQTIDGLARSASLMRQIGASCAASFDIDRDLLRRAERAFAQAGEAAFGKTAFGKALAAETARRAQEVATRGSDRWCDQQREALSGAGGAGIFRK